MIPELDTVKRIIQQSNSQFKNEISKEFEGLIQIGPVSRYDVSGAISVYSITSDLLDKENPVAFGLEELLSNLNKFDKEDISDQFMIKGENSGYEVFADLSKPILHGILKLPQQNIKKSIELTENNQLRGTWTKVRFYLNNKELDLNIS